MMTLRSETREEVTIVHVDLDRIDAAGALLFKESMLNQTGDAAARVVLDLGQVTFVDSSGLGAIVAVMKMLAPDKRLELAALTSPVERVFRLTRMDSVFTIHPQLEGVR